MNARAHGQRRHRREQDRVAVGCGARRRLRRDDGAAARTILHHDRPLELVLQLLRQDAREDVGAAAGGERTEKRHRALGIAVSRRLRGRRVEGEAAGEREHDGSFHALPGGGNAFRAVVRWRPAWAGDATAAEARKASALCEIKRVPLLPRAAFTLTGAICHIPAQSPGWRCSARALARRLGC